MCLMVSQEELMEADLHATVSILDATYAQTPTRPAAGVRLANASASIGKRLKLSARTRKLPLGS